MIQIDFMTKHEEVFCPICNGLFTCKMGDIANCQCNTVQLTEATVNFLAKTNLSCLCKDCLKRINQIVIVAKQHQFPTQKELISRIVTTQEVLPLETQ